jgi:hypothetical protein
VAPVKAFPAAYPVNPSSGQLYEDGLLLLTAASLDDVLKYP